MVSLDTIHVIYFRLLERVFVFWFENLLSFFEFENHRFVTPFSNLRVARSSYFNSCHKYLLSIYAQTSSLFREALIIRRSYTYIIVISEYTIGTDWHRES